MKPKAMKDYITSIKNKGEPIVANDDTRRTLCEIVKQEVNQRKRKARTIF